MIISGEEVLQNDYLIGGDESNLFNATYNLTIGAILHGEEEKDSTYLQPGEVVCVISKEIFRGKERDYTALVNLKSSLTKDGILALDTGYVDPTYEGPIGTILVNFSKNSVYIRKGEPFFRVMFFRHDAIPEERLYTPIAYHSSNIDKALNDYKTVQKKLLTKNFTAHFLNTEKLRSAIEEEIVNTIEPKIYGSAATKFIGNNLSSFLFSVLLLAGIFVVGLNWFASRVTENLTDKDSPLTQILVKRIAEELSASKRLTELTIEADKAVEPENNNTTTK